MKSQNRRRLIAAAVAVSGLALTGCNTVGSAAADLGLAGAGGVAGYQVSDGKIGGAAAGAALGYLGSRVAQSEIQRGMSEAEKRGYDRAMNQAVKQQYWLMQAQQRARPADERDARLVPVVIPENKINGVIQAAHVEYLRVEP
jgi:predicted small secreted protein